MEKPKLSQNKMLQHSLTAKLKAFIVMRNIKIPVFMYTLQVKQELHIRFDFNNMPLYFTITNLDTAYEEAIAFIEDMNDNFITDPIGEYMILPKKE